MKKIILFILVFSIISCADYIGPNQYTQEAIDKDYPYFNVGVSGFFVFEEATNYIELTVAEKRVFLECLALMRTVANTEEFPVAISNASQEFKLDHNISKGPGVIYESTIGTPANRYRLWEVVAGTSYDVEYGKHLKNEGAAYATVGENYYSYYTKDRTMKPGTRIWGPNDYLVSWAGFGTPYGMSSFTALLFHEHMHNIGFTHNGGGVIPYDYQAVVQELCGRILDGDLKDKYSKDLDRLTAYYLDKYKDHLVSSTVYDPSKK